MEHHYDAPEFEREFTYRGNDLGAVWRKDRTRFRLWAPTAENAQVLLYDTGTPGEGTPRVLAMERAEHGTWVAEELGDLHGVYYTYRVRVDGLTREACDPYAVTTGINGCRGMVLDMASTDPEGWEEDLPPHAGKAPTDAVIYELHVRDLSSHESAGIRHKGKFLGLAEAGTCTPGGIPTGLWHMKELGITHVHLLPVYDFGSVDERGVGDPFNWGYDPVNYNAPEGSYATDPWDGAVRVRELKQAVAALHRNGIGVIMDVVYNHVYDADSFCFHAFVPGYFSRGDSNGSGCGNDTASERAMVRKFIVDSVCHWAQTYHLDGFRFDLVGLLDVDTVNAVVAAVHRRHPHVPFYGEGWELPTALARQCPLAVQKNSRLTPDFAYFSDTLRDALRGSVFDNDAAGFVSGAKGLVPVIRRCFLGQPGWCESPAQTVNYASCHDNMALFDRMVQSNPQASRREHIAMNCLAAAVVLLSQGIPFFQAGEEFLRSKPLPDGSFDHNSYRSGDGVNSLKWQCLEEAEYRQVFQYYKGLIALRKRHSVLRLQTREAVEQAVSCLEACDGVAAFHLRGETELVVVFNPGREQTAVPLPEGKWEIAVSGMHAGTEPLAVAENTLWAEPISAAVAVKAGKE